MSNVFADSVPGVPEYMTWEELAALPDELARRIELHSGRVGIQITHPFPIDIGWDALEF